jgi:hypothetical protein
MGILQHRRSISAKASVYARLHAHCKAHDLSVAGFVERVIIEALDRAAAPTPIVSSGGYPKRLRDSTEMQARDLAKHAAAHFTF